MAERWQSAPAVAAWQSAPAVEAEPDAPEPKAAAAGPMEYASGFLGGVNRGLLDLVPGREAIQGAFPRMFPEPPDTGVGRFTARVGREIGASAPMAAGILGMAPRMAQAGGQLAQSFFKPIASTPGRAAVGEALAATGAGAGAGIAREAFPGNVPAEMVGQVAGAMAPAALAHTPTALGVRALRGAINYFRPEAQSKEAAKVVGAIMGSALDDTAKTGLDQAAQLRQRIPGFEPSVAEATGSPSLIRTQEGLEARATGGDLNRMVARRSGSEEAIEKFAAGQAPSDTGGPEYVVDTANQAVTDLRGRVGAEIAEMGTRRQDVAGGLPSADRVAAGKSIRERLLNVRQDTKERLGKRADELGLNDVDVSRPMEGLRREMIKLTTPESMFEDLSNYPAAITETLKKMKVPSAAQFTDAESFRKALTDASEGIGKNEPFTFRDLKALRERVSDDLMDTMAGSNPNRKAARLLIGFRQKIDEAINQVGEGTPLAGNYKQFRKEYFNDYINRFERGAAFKVRERDARSFYKTADEKVADAFFSPGRVTNARQFKEVFGADEAANAALEATAVDSLRDAAVRDGVIDPQRFKRWMLAHDDVLNEFPGIRSKLTDAASANEALIVRQANLAERSKQIGDQMIARSLASYAKGTRTAEQVIESALLEPRLMGQIKTAVGNDPDALEALRRTVWNKVVSATDDPAKFADEFQKRAASIKSVLSAEHMQAIDDILAARSMLARTKEPGGGAFKPNPLEGVEDRIGQKIPQLSSRIFAWRSGRMQKGYLAVDTFMRTLRGRSQSSADDLLKSALYDRDVAVQLAEALGTGTLSQEGAKRLGARVFALGLTPIRDDSQEAE